MPLFPSYDSTRLAYHVTGSGAPLVCLPGGPARAGSYLEDLGGLSPHRTLIVLDHRGTGESGIPDDPATYRCDRLVDDVEALRVHLGLDRMDLLGHSAGGNVAQFYAARFPERLARLVLVTPGLQAVGLDAIGFEEAIDARAGEWWYPAARAAGEAWQEAVGRGASDEEIARLRAATAPFAYGRWNERSRAHSEAGPSQCSDAGAAGFYADFEPDVTALRADLARLDGPVLIVAGALDPAPTPAAAARLAELFPQAEVTELPNTAHFPWVDEPAAFVRCVVGFLDRPR